MYPSPARRSNVNANVLVIMTMYLSIVTLVDSNLSLVYFDSESPCGASLIVFFCWANDIRSTWRCVCVCVLSGLGVNLARKPEV